MGRSAFRDLVPLRAAAAAAIALFWAVASPAASAPHPLPFLSCPPIPLTAESNRSLQKLTVLFVGEGWTPSEAGQFQDRARELAAGIMAFEPFKSFSKGLAFYAAGTVEPHHFGVLPSKPKSGECGFKDDGAATRTRVDAARRALLERADYVVILVKSDLGMGCGGGSVIYATSNISAAMLVHELGHSVGALRDEYEGTHRPDPDRARRNCTATLDRSAIAWRDFISDKTPLPSDCTCPGCRNDENVVGGYSGCDRAKELYRPTASCLMGRYGTSEFCLVCQQWMLRELDAQTRRYASGKREPPGPRQKNLSLAPASGDTSMEITFRVRSNGEVSVVNRGRVRRRPALEPVKGGWLLTFYDRGRPIAVSSIPAPPFTRRAYRLADGELAEDETVVDDYYATVEVPASDADLTRLRLDVVKPDDLLDRDTIDVQNLAAVRVESVRSFELKRLLESRAKE